MQFLVPLPGVGRSEHSELGSIGDKDINNFNGSNSAHGGKHIISTVQIQTLVWYGDYWQIISGNTIKVRTCPY